MQIRNFRGEEQEKRWGDVWLDGSPFADILLTGQLVNPLRGLMSHPNPVQSIPPRWQRRPEARTEEILDAAMVVFGESGFARAKIEDVARLAGVSTGLVSMALSDHPSVAVATKAVVRRAAAQLDYVPNSVGTSFVLAG